MRKSKNHYINSTVAKTHNACTLNAPCTLDAPGNSNDISTMIDERPRTFMPTIGMQASLIMNLWVRNNLSGSAGENTYLTRFERL